MTTIYLVDEDIESQKALRSVVESSGHEAMTFASADDLLKDQVELGETSDHGSCIVVDSRIKGTGVKGLLNLMSRRPNPAPVIVCAVKPSTSFTVQVMKAGAVTLLEKPIDATDLLNAVSEAVGQSESQRTLLEHRQQILSRAERLTEKERAVMALMSQGMANKVIANRLGVSVRTIESRRSAVLEKMGVDSLARLVRAIVEAGL